MSTVAGASGHDGFCPGVQGPGPAQHGARQASGTWPGSGLDPAKPIRVSRRPGLQATGRHGPRQLPGPVPARCSRQAGRALYSTAQAMVGCVTGGCSPAPLSSPVNSNTRGSRWDISAWLHSTLRPIPSAPRPYPEGSLETSPAPDLGEVMKGAHGSDDKASAYSAGDLGSIPASGRSPGEGNGNPLQYSCLENPMDGRVW